MLRHLRGPDVGFCPLASFGSCAAIRPLSPQSWSGLGIACRIRMMKRPPKSAISTASHRAFWLAGHSGTSRRHRGMQSWPGKNAPLLPGH